MKKIKLAVCVLFAGIVLSSCGSSSDGGGDDVLLPVNLQTPKYKNVSALYNITSSSGKYKSVELTEAGNYVIIAKNSLAREFTVNEATDLAIAPWYQTATTRSTTYQNIITGKYTQKDDNTFELEGFGTITITSSDGTTTSLDIVENSGSSYTLTAAKKTQLEGSEQTNHLCRTWSVASLRMKLSGNVGMVEGISLPDFSFDESVNGGDLPGLMTKFYRSTLNWAAQMAKQYGQDAPSSSEIEKMVAEESAKYANTLPSVDGFLFSQTGTYMVTYGNGTLAIATWSWEEKGSNVMQYSWDYGNMSSAALAGKCTVQFSGSQCILTEDKVVNGINAKMIYTLSEAQ